MYAADDYDMMEVKTFATRDKAALLHKYRDSYSFPGLEDGLYCAHENHVCMVM